MAPPHKKGSVPKWKLPPLKMKQKMAKENKVVRPENLQWKTVEIPDSLGDYSGFFGLEELEGVDVKMVDGRAEFIAKGDGEDEDEPEKKKQKKDTPEEEEFVGFDEREKKQQKQQKRKEKKKEKKEKPEKSNKEENAFSALDSLEMTEIDLPQWSKLPLSRATLGSLQKSEFWKPTPIQEAAIPLALDGRDVIGKATTGSGKTYAYGIPILEAHLRRTPAKGSENAESSSSPEKTETPKKAEDEAEDEAEDAPVPPPTAVIFAPTRELAHQVADHLRTLSQFSPLAPHGVVSVTGGLSAQKQERVLRYGPGVVVATPGRFLELLEDNEDLCKRMANTATLVLDEADRLLQDGHFEEFEKILELMSKNRNHKEHGWRWQTMVFSATFSRDLFGKLSGGSKKKAGLAGNDEILELLKEKLRFKDPKPALCDANPKELVASQVTEALVECGPTERDLYLYYFLLMYPGSTLVFANAVETVRRLAPLLENLGVPAFSIHSSMAQKQRLRALERFRAASGGGRTAVLIASDVAARGLDIPRIDHVAHYHLPRSADVYVHRSGRTARAGHEGVSVMFCSPQEAAGPFKKLRSLVAQQNSKMSSRADVRVLHIDHDILAQLKRRIRPAAKLADSQLSQTATRKEDSWLREAAEELGVEDLDDIERFEDDVLKKQRRRHEKKALSRDESRALKAELRAQLQVPIRKNHRRSYLTSGLDNLAHQIVSGNTSEHILGQKSKRALDELRR